MADSTTKCNFLLGIKLVKKTSLGVLNFKGFSWSVV